MALLAWGLLDQPLALPFQHHISPDLVLLLPEQTHGPSRTSVHNGQQPFTKDSAAERDPDPSPGQHKCSGLWDSVSGAGVRGLHGAEPALLSLRHFWLAERHKVNTENCIIRISSFHKKYFFGVSGLRLYITVCRREKLKL